MPLNVSGLTAGLLASRSNLGNTPQTAGRKMAQAAANFWSSGVGPGGASVLGASTKSVMEPEMVAAYASLATLVSEASKVAKAIDNAFKGIILNGGAYNKHISMTTPGPSQLQAQLIDIWSSLLPTPAVVAAKEAKAIHAYTLTGIAKGTGRPSVPIPPQTGPIT